ncbi:MAG: lysophospholipid acyltransferase family protein [Actinomycetota bacterium]
MADARVIPISSADARPRCAHHEPDGHQCRNRAGDSGFCTKHTDAVATEGIAAATARHPSSDSTTAFQAAVTEALAFLRRRMTGEYDIDDMGFDEELTESVLLPVLRPLFERWWRVEQVGIGNVPTDGPVLLVANHSGTVPWDALMLKYGVFDQIGRHVRLLAADLALTLPLVGELARKSGNTLACEEDALRLLRSGEVVGVFPEGFKGIGKPFRDRYRLQRFGRGGFVEVALRSGVPIVPVAIVGAEEIYPIMANIKPIARLLGFPYFPVTPTFPALGPLGAIPLPSKWIIEYGQPIETKGMDSESANDPMFVFNLTDQVREVIQQTLFKNLIRRGKTFF